MKELIEKSLNLYLAVFWFVMMVIDIILIVRGYRRVLGYVTTTMCAVLAVLNLTDWIQEQKR